MRSRQAINGENLMRRKSWMRTFVVGAVLPAVLLCAGCRPETLASVWHSSPSGGASGGDWWNLPAYRVKDFPGRIIVANDSSNLCLGLYSPDRHLARRLRSSGLTVSLTNAQNKSEKLVIRYPVGMHRGQRDFRPNRFLPNADLPPSEMGAMLDVQHDEIEILAEDSTRSGRKSLDDAAQIGVSASLAQADSAVEYLLLITATELAPWLKPGSKVLLEIESLAMERPKSEGRRSPDEHGWEPGGMPPGGGGGGGGGGFPPGGGRGGQHRGGPEGRGQQDDAISSDRAIRLSFVIDLAVRPAS
jgi:hypothetical protein